MYGLVYGFVSETSRKKIEKKRFFLKKIRYPASGYGQALFIPSLTTLQAVCPALPLLSRLRNPPCLCLPFKHGGHACGASAKLHRPTRPVATASAGECTLDGSCRTCWGKRICWNQCDLNHVCPNACCRWRPNLSAPQLERSGKGKTAPKNSLGFDCLASSLDRPRGRLWQALHETKRQLPFPFAQFAQPPLHWTRRILRMQGLCPVFFFAFWRPLPPARPLPAPFRSVWTLLVIFWARLCSCLALRAHSSKSSFEKGCSPTIWKTLRSDPGSPTNNCIISQSHALLASDTQKTCSSTQSSRLRPPTPRKVKLYLDSLELSKSDFHWVRSGGKTDQSIFRCVQGVRNKSQDERIGWNAFSGWLAFPRNGANPIVQKIKVLRLLFCCQHASTPATWAYSKHIARTSALLLQMRTLRGDCSRRWSETWNGCTIFVYKSLIGLLAEKNMFHISYSWLQWKNSKTCQKHLGFRFINNKTGLSCSSSNPARGLRVHFKWGRWNKHASATNKPKKQSVLWWAHWRTPWTASTLQKCCFDWPPLLPWNSK